MEHWTVSQGLTDQLNALQRVTLPDLWQQQAVAALRSGHDVVVQAPTGAGKTLIFELWSNEGRNREQAIYTVPTRALANDKLAEWRRRGWNAGIATGDLADNLDAPILVATLETQKSRLIRGEGPALLVVDEYQMIGDSQRGLNYELALALAPPQTQLLLLSGSVANPQHVVEWLERLGRRAVLVSHVERPVPLDEIFAEQLHYHLPANLTGYWPRLLAKALAEDLGPILVFAPQRRAAEKLARELARKLPNPNPLNLTPEQKALVGEPIARLLKCRIAYHHSGLSYAARAGVIEPLSKAGQLRIVVATMGLAAGINFSLRTVAVAGNSYRRDCMEQPLRPDEILQMFGRAGRRGIDERGYGLISNTQIRIHEGYPVHLSRSGKVDWGALLGIMHAAVQNGRNPYSEAIRVQKRLFTTKPIWLGVEGSMQFPNPPCRLDTDAERARYVRRRRTQILNSAGQWQAKPEPRELPAGQVWVSVSPAPPTPGPDQPEAPPSDSPPSLVPFLTQPEALQHQGADSVTPIATGEYGEIYGRSVALGEILAPNRIILSKWLRKFLRWKGQYVTPTRWENKVLPHIRKRFQDRNTPIDAVHTRNQSIFGHLDLAQWLVSAMIDEHGKALWRPHSRVVMQPECLQCNLVPVCREYPVRSGTALTWRRLGLVESDGTPTRRGIIVSFFSQGNGLAIAAALEDEQYPVDEIVYDLANLDAEFRFCGEGSRWEGRLAYACRQVYRQFSIPGYLDSGVPPRYGAGADQLVASLQLNPHQKFEWTNDNLGIGDIDRIIIEWRSLLRQIVHAPDLDWPRWHLLKEKAGLILNETESPTITHLPPVDYSQQKRIEHRLAFRRP